MAQEIIIVLRDDVDGHTGDDIQTVPFAYNGVTYEIDMGKKSMDRMARAMEPYLSAARRTGGRSKSSPAKKAAASKTTSSGNGTSARASERETREANAKVRTWANDNGFSVGDKGKIPEAVKAAYDAAMAGETANQ